MIPHRFHLLAKFQDIIARVSRQPLRSSLASFREKPHLGRLVASELTNDPLFSLVFAERMCATFLALDKNADLISALELFIARWAGLLQIEIGAWARRDPGATNTGLQVRLITVSAVDFPTLKAAPQKLGVMLHKRAEPTYLERARTRPLRRFSPTSPNSISRAAHFARRNRRLGPVSTCWKVGRDARVLKGRIRQAAVDGQRNSAARPENIRSPYGITIA